MGRPKGALNKTTRAANEAFDFAFQEIGGAEFLAQWAAQNPTEFFRIYAKRITIDTNVSGEVTLKVHRDLPEEPLERR